MKRFYSLILAFVLILMVFTPVCTAEGDHAQQRDRLSPYIVGAEAKTFAALYTKMCFNLDLEKAPLPEPERTAERSIYGKDGGYEAYTVLKDDGETYETIGTICRAEGEREYIIRRWVGYYEDQSIIGMEVYYTPDGKYLGSIRRDYASGRATASSRCPFLVAGDPVTKP